MSAGPASLHDLFVRHGTDKAAHGYTPTYERLLGPRRHEALALLELGVAAGRSLRAWLDWLPAAQVAGLDRELPCQLRVDLGDMARLSLYRGLQQDWRGLRRLFAPGTLDVVIDDASHRPEDQIVAVHALWPALRPGAVYVIEDIQGPAELEMLRHLPGQWQHEHTGPSRDDQLVVLRKPGNDA